MTIKRLDHVSVVVDDLAAAIAFFTALGMTIEGEMPVEAPLRLNRWRRVTIRTRNRIGPETDLRQVGGLLGVLAA